MKRNLFSCFALALAVICAAVLFPACEKKSAWITSYADARDLARETGKDVLFCFTGSDWNPDSTRLLDVVFKNDFVKKTQKKFILCHLDIVQDSSLMDPLELETNFKLASRYALSDFPAFVLLTSEGDVYGMDAFRVPEQDFSADDVFSFLASFDANREKLISLKDAVRNSEGVERARRIDEFLSAVYPSQFEEYEAMIHTVPDLDKDNEAGLRGRYLLQCAWFNARGLYQMNMLEEAVACFYEILDDAAMTPALRQEALYLVANFYAADQAASAEKLISVLEEAIAMDPENPNVGQLASVIESIRRQAQQP